MTPKIVSSNIEIIILDREIGDGPRVGNIRRVVSLYPDGSAFVKEVLVDPSTIMFRKKVLMSNLFYNFFKFQLSCRQDAELVRRYLKKELSPLWLERGYG